MNRLVERTAGSSFDQKLFEEVEIAVSGGYDSGIPVNFDDHLYGQESKNDAEANFQRGQEVANTIATQGWKYIDSLLNRIVEEYSKAKDNAEGDVQIVESHREWKVSKKIVDQIRMSVIQASEVLHPDDLPR